MENIGVTRITQLRVCLMKIVHIQEKSSNVEIRVSKGLLLTLNAQIATKVVCFSRLLKFLRILYDEQCGPKSDCSYRSSMIWVHPVCFYT